MDRPLPIKDGWYRVPGDGKNPNDPATRESPRFWSSHQYFWAYVEFGIAVRLTMFTDGKVVPDEYPGGLERAYVPDLEKDWDANLMGIMWRTYGLLGQNCRWNGMSTGYAKDADLLPVPPKDQSSALGELVIITEAVGAGRSSLKRTMRNWPYCPLGGTVNLSPCLDRSFGSVLLKWHCHCGK